MKADYTVPILPSLPHLRKGTLKVQLHDDDTKKLVFEDEKS